MSKLIEEINGDLNISSFSLKSFIAAYYFNAAFRVLLNHRIGKYYFQKNRTFFSYLSARYKYKLISNRNCDISYKSQIGKNLILPHPIGIVIGDGVIIEDNVKIYQNVTLGSHGKRGMSLAYPTIKQGTIIYAGAIIVGGITLGENSIIGAGAFVNKSVPPGAKVFGPKSNMTSPVE